MQEEKHLCTLRDVRGEPPNSSNACLDLCPSLSKDGLPYTVEPPSAEAREEGGSQNVVPTKDVASSTRVAAPVMMDAVTVDATGVSSAPQQSSPSILVATPPLFGSVAAPQCAEMKTAVYSAVSNQLGTEEEMQNLRSGTGAASTHVSIVDINGNAGEAVASLPSVGEGAHRFENGRSRRKLCKPEVSFLQETVTAPGAGAAPSAAIPGANHGVVSGKGHLRSSHTGFGKANGAGSVTLSGAGGCLLPADGTRGHLASRTSACPNYQASSSANEGKRFDGTETVSGTLGSEKPLLSTILSAEHLNRSPPLKSGSGAARRLVSLSSNTHSDTHCVNQHHYTADASTTNTCRPECRPDTTAAATEPCSCRVPVSVALVINTVITVILVASLTIVPLNSVSMHLLDYVMSTLSLSLASSYTRSVEATMRFLPNAINAYAFSYMNSSDTQAWNWTAADMPQALRQMCQAVTGTYRNPTSFLLYMSLSSPYTGYSAYCSQQYSDDDLIGNYIIDNSSQPRYFINTTTYNYAEPLTVYPAVQAMTPWEYTVDFGATENPWHTIVMPWYEHYQKSRLPGATAGPAVVPGAAFEADRIFSEESEFPFPNSPKGLNGHWRVFIGNVSVITYTLPFVDYAGNPASIMGALCPDGFNALHQYGAIAAGSNARAMVVDTTSGLVFITSWDQNTSVRLDSWSTSCNCAPGGSDQRAVYLEDITDSLMMAAVQYVGGREAIANTPLEVNRWSGQFTHNGSQNLMVINRVNISSDYSGMHLVVIYVMCKDDFTSFITHLQVTTLVAVALVLVVIALVEVALMYLLVQPVRGVAAGLRAAAQLRNGKEFVEHATSVIKEIAEMQRDFHIMNTKLMQMKTFLPQGMLGGTTVSSDIQGFSDGDLVAFGTSALHGKGEGGVWENAHGDDGYDEACDVLGGDGSVYVCAAQPCTKDSYADVGSSLWESEAGRRRRQSCIPPVAEVTHLRLNDRVLLEEVNHFHRRYCSTIVFCMHLMEEEISVRFLNQNCVYFTEGVLPCVLRYGGVVELQRPDYIVVSFGAHNKVALHQNRAAMCALEVMQVLNSTTPIGPRVGCLIDASEYYVGTCGAVDRNALVTFSNNLVPKGDLIRVLKSVQTQIVLTQRLASTLESSMLVMPVDCMVLNPLSMNQIILYELRGHVRMLPSKVSVAMVRKVIRAVRMGFTHMLKGDYGKALEILAPFEIMELQAARLGFMCRVLVSRHINRPFVRSVTRLTFSEAHFAGYDEGCPKGWGESHESGTPFGGHGHQCVTEGLMDTANPLTVGGGAYSFPFSPFNNDLDPALLLMTPPPMRLVVGAPLNPPSVKKGDCQRMNSDSVTVATASASTCANEGSQTRHGSSCITEGKPEQNALERVAAAHAAADEGETALFEIFVDAQFDDDDDVDDGEAEVAVGGNRAGSRAYYSACNEVTNNGRFGSGEMPAEECTAASMIAGKVMHSRCKNELPLVFTDYEGNTWRRSYDILGTGAFSTVHRGLSMTGNLVALKCFQMGARNIQVHAIVDEVRLFAKLHHENVAQYLSLYVSETYVIEIMELVPGGSLDTLLTSFGSLRPESVRRYLRDIVRGLSYLHTANIVHCDIKPHNVLLAMDGQCKLSDFGSAIARATSSICSFDNVLELRGTPGYMAPEVARGDVPTMKSDVYSLGITVLELLTGKLPWEYADAFTRKLSGKLTRHESDSEHPASQLQTCATFPLSDARVADSAVSQAGAHSSENPLNAGSASAQVPLGEPNTDTRLYATTMLSNSSCTGPATSVDETVCGGGSVLSPQSQSSKAAHTLRCLELNSNSVGMAKGSTAPPPCALESTQEEWASATATSLKAATPPDFAHFQDSGTHSTLLENLSAAKNAKADACAEDGSHMPLSGALRRSPEIGQSRQKHNNTSYSPSFASQRSSSTLLPPLPQTPHLAPSPQRRPLEQVLRSPTQLVVHIGRGLVVPRIPDTLDEDVRNFLELCLKPDPAERASISELMLHPWLM